MIINLKNCTNVGSDFVPTRVQAKKDPALAGFFCLYPLRVETPNGAPFRSR